MSSKKPNNNTQVTVNIFMVGVGLMAFATSAPVLLTVGQELGLSFPYTVPLMIDGTIIAMGVTQFHAERVKRHDLRRWAVTGSLFATAVSLMFANYHALSHAADTDAVTKVIMSCLMHSAPMAFLALFIHVYGLMTREPEPVKNSVSRAVPQRQTPKVAHKRVARSVPAIVTRNADTGQVQSQSQVQAQQRAQRSRVNTGVSQDVAQHARDFVALCMDQGLTYDDLAVKWDVSLSTAKRRVKKAKDSGELLPVGDSWRVK